MDISTDYPYPTRHTEPFALGRYMDQKLSLKTFQPPLNVSRIIVKGRSKKDDIPTTCHLCHLDIEEEEVDSLVDCRNCRKLAHRDCEEATGEDCGTF